MLTALLGGPAVAQPAERIAVISAFPPEAQQLRAAVEAPESATVNGIEVTTGRLAGQEVALALTGISMVNAAMTTQLLLDRYPIGAIVVSGIAGGVDPALKIGDVVVAARWGQYLEAIFAREQDGDYVLPPWAEASFPNYGMIFPQPVEHRSAADPAGSERFWFDVDPLLLAQAEGLAPRVELARCTAAQVCLEQAPRLVVGGQGVSGQAFIDNAAFREYVHATFEAQVLDMETAAIATVAHANGVPFIAFRSLSDLAGGGPGENEIGTFFQLAADNAAAVVTAFLAGYAAPTPR
jgi:adenosylhomocysteine nucleosidase